VLDGGWRYSNAATLTRTLNPKPYTLHPRNLHHERVRAVLPQTLNLEPETLPRPSCQRLLTPARADLAPPSPPTPSKPPVDTTRCLGQRGGRGLAVSAAQGQWEGGGEEGGCPCRSGRGAKEMSSERVSW